VLLKLFINEASVGLQEILNTVAHRYTLIQIFFLENEVQQIGLHFSMATYEVVSLSTRTRARVTLLQGEELLKKKGLGYWSGWQKAPGVPNRCRGQKSKGSG